MRMKLIRHQCLSCCWALLTLSQGLFSFSDCPAREGLRGNRKSTKTWHGAKNWPRGYPVPNDIMNKETVEVVAEVAIAQELAGHPPADGEKLHCALLVFNSSSFIYFS